MFIYSAQQTHNTLESAYLFLFDIFFFYTMNIYFIYTENGIDRCKI